MIFGRMMPIAYHRFGPELLILNTFSEGKCFKIILCVRESKVREPSLVTSSVQHVFSSLS